MHTAWYPNLNKRLKSKLWILQNKCIWFCLIRAHTGLNKFEKNKCLLINYHIEQFINSTNFKYFNNLSPAYMNEVLKPSGQNSTTARASLLKLNQSFRKTNCRQNNFWYVAPNTSNKLPDSLKIAEKLNTYKHRVRKHFPHWLDD